jgi:hypothetical protein
LGFWGIGFALGSFGFVWALGAPDGPKIGFVLGSFGFVLALGAILGRKTGVGLALFGFVWVRFGFVFRVENAAFFP